MVHCRVATRSNPKDEQCQARAFDETSFRLQGATVCHGLLLVYGCGTAFVDSLLLLFVVHVVHVDGHEDEDDYELR